jgi:AcrR family transcriptional regulator
VTKGADTRLSILDEATDLASQVGLAGLTIGSLATRTGLSKSGLFAHFRSKESLQVQVLDRAAERFRDIVVFPALSAPRGEPRLRALFEGWLSWSTALRGGCVFVAASAEFDDQPGPVRDRLVRDQRDWFETIARVVQTAVTEGHLRPGVDPDQFGQDLYGVLLAFHHVGRLLGDPAAERRARTAFEALLNAARA